MRWPCSEQSTEFSDMVRVRPLTLNRLVSEECVFVGGPGRVRRVECHYVFKEWGLGKICVWFWHWGASDGTCFACLIIEKTGAHTASDYATEVVIRSVDSCLENVSGSQVHVFMTNIQFMPLIIQRVTQNVDFAVVFIFWIHDSMGGRAHRRSWPFSIREFY